MQFYTDTDKKIMDEKLVVEEAEKFVKQFVLKKPNREGKLVLDTNNSISSAQLRKFYNEFKSIEQALKVRTDEQAFNSVLPKIKLTIAKVEYVKSRGHVPVDFAKWLKNCVTEIKDRKDFEAFLLHFEAIVGFAYGNGLKD